MKKLIIISGLLLSQMIGMSQELKLDIKTDVNISTYKTVYTFSLPPLKLELIKQDNVNFIQNSYKKLEYTYWMIDPTSNKGFVFIRINLK